MLHAARKQAGADTARSRWVHGTASAELRLFQGSVFGLFSPDTSWRVSGFADVSRLYFGWGFGVGTWH
ncbi:hypothetical protein D7V80_02355 [Corallococcus sp. CA054B]|nr:hypothetical protein D7V80_02355 [Corallococcus sp. CA054B]